MVVDDTTEISSSFKTCLYLECVCIHLSVAGHHGLGMQHAALKNWSNGGARLKSTPAAAGARAAVAGVAVARGRTLVATGEGGEAQTQWVISSNTFSAASSKWASKRAWRCNFHSR